MSIDNIFTSIFTEEELEVLILAIIGSYGDEGVDSDTIKKHVDWASKMRIANELVDLLMAGYVTTTWRDELDEPDFTIKPLESDEKEGE